MSRDTFFVVSVSSRSRNPKVSSRSRNPKFSSRSRTTVFGSRSRYCSDVGKAHRCCKYVMIFSKNKLFVRFFNYSGIMILFKHALVTVELNNGDFYRGCGFGRFKIFFRSLSDSFRFFWFSYLMKNDISL